MMTLAIAIVGICFVVVGVALKEAKKGGGGEKF
jgi:hypothetical protein